LNAFSKIIKTNDISTFRPPPFTNAAIFSGIKRLAIFLNQKNIGKRLIFNVYFLE